MISSECMKIDTWFSMCLFFLKMKQLQGQERADISDGTKCEQRFIFVRSEEKYPYHQNTDEK